MQLGVLEMHPWGSRADAIETPDRLTFDIDPSPELPWARVCDAARHVREHLRGLGLESWPKTTGGEGLHVVVPVLPDTPWDAVKELCRSVAEELVRDHPDLYLSKASKAARKGKVFIDWLRNGRGSTAVAAYSARARPDAPVSLPIGWSDLARARPGSITLANVPAKLARRRSDPWAGFWKTRQSLRDV